jgi:DNA-binding FadR family transcriptional regulator
VLNLREALTTWEASHLVTLPDGRQSTVADFLASLTEQEAAQLIWYQGQEEKGIGVYNQEDDRLLCWIHWSRPTKGDQA